MKTSGEEMKIVTIFGSALPKVGDEEYETAYKLGKYLGEKGFGICTGGYQGIMEAASKGNKDAGGYTIGVIVDLFNRKPNPYLDEIIEEESLFDRINTLIEKGDAFIALRGGTGTLLELVTVWEFFNKNLTKKRPVAAHGKMWKSLVEEINNRMIFENRSPDIVKSFEDIFECADYIIKKL